MTRQTETKARAEQQAAIDHAADAAMAKRPATVLDLSGYNDADLLTAAYALTHRMDREHGDTPAAANLRTQRDLITAETLRRMGGR